MTAPRSVPDAVSDVVATALGKRHRADPISAGTGGAAGNARLTAWLGLLLLVLFLAELFTVLDVTWLISWHIAIGVLLIPPSLAKTATTGWRLARYYTRSSAYVAAGPPPLLLRILGPLVVLGTLGVLGTGVLVGLLGPSSAFQPLLHVPGLAISALTLHQASVFAWAATTGLHVLARVVPAAHLARPTSPSVPGNGPRVAVLAATAVIAAALAVLGLTVGSDWTRGRNNVGPSPRQPRTVGAENIQPNQGPALWRATSANLAISPPPTQLRSRLPLTPR
jgi:hypothetical protein